LSRQIGGADNPQRAAKTAIVTGRKSRLNRPQHFLGGSNVDALDTFRRFQPVGPLIKITFAPTSGSRLGH